MSGFEVLLQQIVNGVTVGSYLALIALGYTMVYGVLQLINFAHGEVFMVGAFAGYATLLAFGGEALAHAAAQHEHRTANRRRLGKELIAARRGSAGEAQPPQSRAEALARVSAISGSACP